MEAHKGGHGGRDGSGISASQRMQGCRREEGGEGGILPQSFQASSAAPTLVSDSWLLEP